MTFCLFQDTVEIAKATWRFLKEMGDSIKNILQLDSILQFLEQNKENVEATWYLFYYFVIVFWTCQWINLKSFIWERINFTRKNPLQYLVTSATFILAIVNIKYHCRYFWICSIIFYLCFFIFMDLLQVHHKCCIRNGVYVFCPERRIHWKFYQRQWSFDGI